MLAIASASLLSFQLLFSSLTIQSYICYSPVEPIISSPANDETVYSAKPVVIKGTATADTNVQLTDNGQVYATVTADQYNNFSAQAYFTEGNHELGVTTTNPCGSSTGSKVNIIAKPNLDLPPSPVEPSMPPISPQPDDTPPVAPNLPQTSNPNADSTKSPTKKKKKSSKKSDQKNVFMISDVYPLDGYSTNNASVYISGTMNKPATVEVVVNDRIVASTLRTQTSFGMSVPLSLGDNTITITTRAGKEQASTVLTVKRVKKSSEKETAPTIKWYNTAPGKAVIASSILLIILICLIIFL